VKRKMLLFAAVMVVAVVMLAGQALAYTAGEKVDLAGTISAVTEGNEFVLKLADGTEIRVDGGPSWYKALTLELGFSVSVFGEVGMGKDGTKPAEIDAITLTVDGVATDIRPETGRPPWAGTKGKGAGGGGAPDGVVDDD
jgi:hypothetical protein